MTREIVPRLLVLQKTRQRNATTSIIITMCKISCIKNPAKGENRVVEGLNECQIKNDMLK